jgi:hypothetical protein
MYTESLGVGTCPAPISMNVVKAMRLPFYDTKIMKHGPPIVSLQTSGSLLGDAQENNWSGKSSYPLRRRELWLKIFSTFVKHWYQNFLKKSTNDQFLYLTGLVRK